MSKRKLGKRAAGGALRRFMAGFGSFVVTLLLFMVLPLINRIAEGSRPDTIVERVNTADLPPPEAVEEEEDPEEEEPEEDEPPPELAEPLDPIDLSQLEMMASLTDGLGAEGFGGADFSIKNLTSQVSDDVDSLIGAGDLDGGRPTPISEGMPSLNNREKKATPGVVTVLFIVDTSGRVSDVRVKEATSEVLSKVALKAVKKWRYKQGTKDGKPVSYRIRRRLRFPKQ